MSNDPLLPGPILPRQSIKIMDYDDTVIMTGDAYRRTLKWQRKTLDVIKLLLDELKDGPHCVISSQATREAELLIKNSNNTTVPIRSE